MSTTTFPDRWRPTLSSTTVVAVLTVATGAVLALTAGVPVPAAVGAVGGLAMAVALRVLDGETRRWARTLVASALLLPAGIGLVGASLGTGLVVVGGVFPVTAAGFPATAVDVAATVSVACAVAVAVFGAAIAARGPLSESSVERTTRTALKTTIVPFVVGTTLAVQTILGHAGSAGTGRGPFALLGEFVGLLSRALLQPDPAEPEIATFALLVGFAFVVADRTIRALPVAEIVTEADTDADLEAALTVVNGILHRGGVALLVTFSLVAIWSVLAPAARIETLLSPGLYGAVRALTTATILRHLAWWTIVVGLVVLLVLRVLRRLVVTSPERTGTVLAPFAVGVGVTVITAWIAGPAVDAGIQWAAATLPGRFAAAFREIAAVAVEFYGATTIAVGLVALVLVTTAAAVAAFLAVLRTTYLTERTAGPALASAGLFQATVFAGVQGAGAVVVLGGLLAALLVWDVGEFGTTLGREVGPLVRTRRTEFVHATGTLVVGFGGALLALAIARAAPATATDLGAVVLGLVVGVAGLVLLVVALR